MGMLLVALLATDSLSETDEKTRIVANLKSATKRCPLTGKKTFVSALAAVLSSSEIATQVAWIEAERGDAIASAVIVYRQKPGDKDLSRSVFGRDRLGLIRGLTVKATLWLPFATISRDLEANPGRH